jgi:hypothetical protein
MEQLSRGLPLAGAWYGSYGNTALQLWISSLGSRVPFLVETEYLYLLHDAGPLTASYVVVTGSCFPRG